MNRLGCLFVILLSCIFSTLVVGAESYENLYQITNEKGDIIGFSKIKVGDEVINGKNINYEYRYNYNDNGELLLENKLYYNQENIKFISSELIDNIEQYKSETYFSNGRIISSIVSEDKQYEIVETWNDRYVFSGLIHNFIKDNLSKIFLNQIININVYSPTFIVNSKNIIKTVPFKFDSIEKKLLKINDKDIEVIVFKLIIDSYIGIRILPKNKINYTFAFENNDELKLVYYEIDGNKYQLLSMN